MAISSGKRALRQSKLGFWATAGNPSRHMSQVTQAMQIRRVTIATSSQNSLFSILKQRNIDADNF
jgi:hypothetical protein